MEICKSIKQALYIIHYPFIAVCKDSYVIIAFCF